MDKKFYVQGTIGGFRQTAIFSGTCEDCCRYFNENCWNGSWAIVPEEEYEVDYLY